MASRKNRSGKSNRRSPESASSAVAQHWRALTGWIDAHRWPVAIAGFLVMFVGAGMGGYWLAERFEPKPAKVTYARIEDIPGLPRYIETEPDQKVPTVEDKPRPRPHFTRGPALKYRRWLSGQAGLPLTAAVP